eukprot:m.233173 g.233173  ORF g.233173 m.233173 type:complete len:377 (-) comp18896_c1_seq1:2224-3354(-)
MPVDHYAALEVARDADADTIRSAYRKLARAYHPDKNPGDETARERFHAVREAFDTLSDPSKRRFYDLTRFTSATGSFTSGSTSAAAATNRRGFKAPFGRQSSEVHFNSRYGQRRGSAAAGATRGDAGPDRSAADSGAHRPQRHHPQQFPSPRTPGREGEAQFRNNPAYNRSPGESAHRRRSSDRRFHHNATAGSGHNHGQYHQQQQWDPEDMFSSPGGQPPPPQNTPGSAPPCGVYVGGSGSPRFGPLPAIIRPLPCSLEDLFHGFEKKLKVTRQVECAPRQLRTETVVLTVEGKPGCAPGTQISFPGAGDALLGRPPQVRCWHVAHCSGCVAQGVCRVTWSGLVHLAIATLALSAARVQLWAVTGFQYHAGGKKR